MPHLPSRPKAWAKAPASWLMSFPAECRQPLRCVNGSTFVWQPLGHLFAPATPHCLVASLCRVRGVDDAGLFAQFLLRVKSLVYLRGNHE
jgi:hypothetical protein